MRRKRVIFITSSIANIIYLLPGILIGFSLHEFAHAQTAIWLGDDTPRAQGRNTVNPLAHIDLIGFIMILLAGFGWARPVQINPNRFRNKVRDDMIVSLAGPLMNILVAVLFLILMKASTFMPSGFLAQDTYDIVINIFQYAVKINIVLCVFNLLPVPPLDGSHVLFGLLGLSGSALYHQISRIGTYILLLLILTGILNQIIGPPITFLYHFLTGIFF
ncbi:peptidase M50 [Syntrophobotulus glycolicus DSM 8271]|uniref:Peptidase M50 n=1 Tax=Syntrophobotulus glycolicus (strain DSM 8271 / FlGlyR) TaxID=645991 RepID=F0SZ70_SYNGF|nr:site-2 protease family protein [Syntrophobotulus glycolicus]ADY57188.1 peptidase M50 [Syntrophobotulus glycolicus DSM 8271]